MRAVRPWAWPLVPVYRAVVAAKDWAFGRGWLRVRRLGAPVVSVGSVSAGGAGKTPMVLALAELLARKGLAVRVLSRGYGRGSDEVERVDPGGDAGQFGDEPLLLARRMPGGGAVYVGTERFAAGRLAERELGGNASLSESVPLEVAFGGGVRLPVVFVLDDGFQHRRLGRDLDVVLVTRRDAEDFLLPAGNLREPLRAIRRADVVVVREEEEARLREKIGRIFEASGGGLEERPQADAAGRRPEIWVIRRRLFVDSLPSRAVIFSGIARPDGFRVMLAEEGCAPVAEVRFRDHHRYGDADIERLVKEARDAGADGFVTTEKDWVKLGPGMLARLEEVGPVRVAELRVEFVDEAAAVARLRRLWPA